MSWRPEGLLEKVVEVIERYDNYSSFNEKTVEMAAGEIVDTMLEVLKAKGQREGWTTRDETKGTQKGVFVFIPDE